MIRKLAITSNAVLVSVAFAFELLGIGLITKYREGHMYDFIAKTEVPWFFVILYSLFFFAIPVINIIALLVKDRGFLIEYSGR